MKDQTFAGPLPQAGQSILKFEVYCPVHPDQEMLTGGKAIEYGEKITARCPVCNHAVVMRVIKIEGG